MDVSGEILVQVSLGKTVRPYLKNIQSKRAESSKHETWVQTPVLPKKKKTSKLRYGRRGVELPVPLWEHHPPEPSVHSAVQKLQALYFWNFIAHVSLLTG
jgi:hypothetical protein